MGTKFMDSKNAQLFSILAGVLLILSRLGFNAGMFRFLGFFSLVFAVILAVSIFTGQKNLLAVIGAGGLLLIQLFSTLSTLRYLHVVSLLELLSYAAFFVLVLAMALPQLKLDTYLKTVPAEFQGYLAYVPAALLLLANVIYWIGWYFNLYNFISCLVAVAALFFAAVWVMEPSVAGKPLSFQTASGGSVSGSAGAGSAAPTDGYYDLAMHVILLLVTCGIWQYIWIYRVTRDLNSCPGEEYREPVNKLLLCMFVPFYYIYWTYKSAQRVDKMSAIKGIPSDIATLCLILSIFIGIVPPILIQMKINALSERGARPVTPAAPAAPAPAPAPKAEVDTAEQIRKFKELLDSGAITREEYDAKKKQLLDS